MDTFKPEVVHVHSGSAGFMVRLAVKKQVPVVFTAHGWSFTPGAPFVRRVIALVAEKYIARYTTKVICVSQKDYNLALEYNILPQSQLFHIYNSVHMPSHQEVSSKTFDQIQILFVGRLAPPKDLFILFNAISKLSLELRSKISVHIVGDGPLFDDFRKHSTSLGIEDFVFWHGRQTYETSRRFFETAHIFTLPTHWEGFPMTILEAMSYGLPVIASGVGGVPEIVDETVGYLVDKNNQEEEFKKALELLCSNQELLENLSRQARGRIENSFSHDEFLKRTFALYTNE